MLNANAKLLNVHKVKSGETIVNFKSTGGLLDFYFFTADSAEELVRTYHGLIGKPALPPFWGLGFMQGSRHWGSQEAVTNVLNRYREEGFVFEGVYLDYPYMNNSRNFEIDDESFPNFNSLGKRIHEAH